MRKGRGWIFSLAIVISNLQTAFGLESFEHYEIARIAYSSACVRMGKILDSAPSRTPEAKKRYEYICRRLPEESHYLTPYHFAELYGQACAIAGDFLKEPDDFVTEMAGRRINSKRNYARLALTNSAHFHPSVLRNWRKSRQTALSTALLASTAQSPVERGQVIDRGFYELAFSEHYLQDSFAYGDGMLHSAEANDWRSHVLSMSENSVYGFLHAFIFGELDISTEESVEKGIISLVQAPEIAIWETPPLLGSYSFAGGWEKGTLFGGKPKKGKIIRNSQMEISEAINEPAYLAQTDDIWTSWDGVIRGEEKHYFSAYWGFTRRGYNWGDKMGFGHSESLTTGQRGFAMDVGYERRLGMTNDGFITHEFEAGFRGMYGFSVFYTAYRLNYEFGNRVLSISAGPSWGKSEMNPRVLGYSCGLSLRKIAKTRGGGVKGYRNE